MISIMQVNRDCSLYERMLSTETGIGLASHFIGNWAAWESAGQRSSVYSHALTGVPARGREISKQGHTLRYKLNDSINSLIANINYLACSK